MLPGVTVTVGTAASPQGLPTDTGQAFPVTPTQRGSVTGPTLLQNMADYMTYAGQRQTTSPAYDWHDQYFGEKGKKSLIMRVAAAAATQASLNLLDSSSAVALVARAGLLGAPDPGSWANGATGGLSIAVTQPAAGTFQLTTSLAGVPVETTPPFTALPDAVTWAAKYSKFIVLSLAASTLIPAVAAAANLAGGTDGTIANSDYQNALNVIPGELGPGQVVIPGASSATLQLMALAHAQAYNRFTLLDPADTPTMSSLVAQAQSLYGAPNTARRYGQLAAPYDIIDGLTSLSTRSVPPSARLAAEYALVDALGNPNQSAAGRFGRAQNTLDLSQPNWTASDRLLANNAGVTLSRRRPGGVIATYGLRTLADQNQDVNWSMAPNVRATMWYVAQAKNIGDEFDFSQIDGNGTALTDFGAALNDPAMALYEQGALYGAKPSDAYLIDTSAAANPPAQLETGEVVANVKLKFSPNAEGININIVRVGLTDSV